MHIALLDHWCVPAQCVGEIVAELVRAADSKEDVNLNWLKASVAKK